MTLSAIPRLPGLAHLRFDLDETDNPLIALTHSLLRIVDLKQVPILAALNDYIVEALTLGLVGEGVMRTTLIGIGMWLGAIMWFNVWFVIWPNQQKALNIDNKHPDLAADAKAKSARTAMLFSRTNTVLSIPMLFCMVGAQNL